MFIDIFASRGDALLNKGIENKIATHRHLSGEYMARFLLSFPNVSEYICECVCVCVCVCECAHIKIKEDILTTDLVRGRSEVVCAMIWCEKWMK
jgi:hypothetical protein